ncbi:MAG: BamA/TamA family outer membrane protein [Bacteroidota bacterium]
MSIILFSCNAVKHLEEDEHLLVENKIIENKKEKNKKEIRKLLRQQPNSTLLNSPIKLHIYNSAVQEPDSTFDNWLYAKPKREKRLIKFLSKKQLINLKNSYIAFQERIKSIGEAPTIVSEKETVKSKQRLQSWYWNNGWFNAEIDYEINKEDESKTATVDYFIKTGKPYTINKIDTEIASPAADSIFSAHKNESLIKKGEQYHTGNFTQERDRITQLFRNNGLYHFEKDYINFNADTLGTQNKINVSINISDRQVKSGDSTTTTSFKKHRISEVNIITNYNNETNHLPVSDSAHYNGYTVYAVDKLQYNPKVLTDAVFIKENEIFRDRDRNQTFQRFSDMRVFQYPNIQYQVDPRDEKGEDLIANIILNPKKKLGFTYSNDISQSNVMDFGIGFNTSLLIRNVFKGAEILELSGRGIIGSSKDAASSSSNFFNISEIGANAKISWPTIAFPINTEKVIAKTMSPFTSLSIGYSSQKNIGLDRQNFTGAFSYRWKPKSRISHQLDLVNVQFVNNLNVNNYFNVFQNSYNQLNNLAQNNADQLDSSLFESDTEIGEMPDLLIPEGTDEFLNLLSNNEVDLTSEEQQLASSIVERENRLTENNLIIASNFMWDYSNRKNIDDDNFFQFRARIEAAGNLLSMLADPLQLDKNENNTYNLFDVQFSQYVKTEFNFIKYWDLDDQKVIAVKAFSGIAIPYGNSNSIPFIRSFFAGGPNDNRGWQPYDLGPGTTGGVNDFNEANFKLSFNAEYRFNLFGSLNSAIFIDAGNIWNVWDSVTDPKAKFDSLSSITEMNIGSGFGLRYDLDFFVIRVDLGFKTYEPGLDGGSWFKNYNFANVVYNFGINYPF